MKTLKEARKYLREKYGAGDAFRRPAGSLAPKYAVLVGKRITGQGPTLDDAIADAARQLGEAPGLVCEDPNCGGAIAADDTCSKCGIGYMGPGCPECGRLGFHKDGCKLIGEYVG